MATLFYAGDAPGMTGALPYGDEPTLGGDTTPPTLGGAITIGTVTATSIAITWPAGSDNVAVTSYEVSKDGGSTWTDTGSTTTGYTFTGLTPSTSYSLRVRAKDAAGNVSTPPLSATQSTGAAGDSTPPTLGGAITIGTVTSTSIAITWGAGSDNVAVTSYEVSSDGGSTWTDTGSTTTGYTFSGLIPSTSYALRVRAKDAAGNVSTPALAVSQATSAASDATPPVLTGVLGVSALATTSYTLTWPAASDNVAVTSYERSLDGGSTWVDVGNVLTVNITGRTPGSSDLVRIRAKDAAGNVSTPALSTTVTLVADSSSPEPVTLAEAKLAARVDDDTTLDPVIQGYIASARRMAEQETGRTYVQRTQRYKLADWPSADRVMHVHGATAVAIQWWDGTQWQNLDVNAYAWDELNNGTAVAPALNAAWPTLGDKAIGHRVRVDITAGSATPAVDTPQCVKDFIKAVVAHWISYPEAGAAASLQEAPFLGRLLDPERLWGA